MKYTLRINALNIKLRIVQILIKVEVVRAVLTENLFQDNKADVDFLLSDQGRQAIVNLHLKAIEDYINGN